LSHSFPGTLNFPFAAPLRSRQQLQRAVSGVETRVNAKAA
jgi:hypothetical protein